MRTYFRSAHRRPTSDRGRSLVPARCRCGIGVRPCARLRLIPPRASSEPICAWSARESPLRLSSASGDEPGKGLDIALSTHARLVKKPPRPGVSRVSDREGEVVALAPPSGGWSVGGWGTTQTFGRFARLSMLLLRRNRRLQCRAGGDGAGGAVRGGGVGGCRRRHHGGTGVLVHPMKSTMSAAVVIPAERRCAADSPNTPGMRAQRFSRMPSQQRRTVRGVLHERALIRAPTPATAAGAPEIHLLREMAKRHA